MQGSARGEKESWEYIGEGQIPWSELEFVGQEKGTGGMFWRRRRQIGKWHKDIVSHCTQNSEE